MTTLEAIGHLVHSIRNLPQRERMLAVNNITKAALELTNPDETAFVFTTLGLSLCSNPPLMEQMAKEWVGILGSTRKRQR